MTDYRIFPATDGPPDSVSDGQPLNLAMEVRTTGQTWVTALHFWRGTTAITGTITGRLFTVDSAATGTPVAGTDVTFTLAGTGWQTAVLTSPVELSPDVRHKVVVHFPDQFPITGAYWAAEVVNGPLRAYSNDSSVAGQGSFSAGSIDNYPASTNNSANYWVDLTVTDVDPTGGGPVDLEGVASAAASASAGLTAARALAGKASGSGSATSTLTVARRVSATSNVAGSATASLVATRPLSGSAQAASSATASLTVTSATGPLDEIYRGGRTVVGWQGGRTRTGWSGGRTVS